MHRESEKRGRLGSVKIKRICFNGKPAGKEIGRVLCLVTFVGLTSWFLFEPRSLGDPFRHGVF